MASYKIFIVLFFLNLTVKSQEKHRELSLTVDNDLLTDRDEYYTSGITLSYNKRLSNSFIFKKIKTIICNSIYQLPTIYIHLQIQ